MKIKNVFLALCSFLCLSLSACSKSIVESGYKITWKDSDGTVLAVSHDVSKGTMPSCPAGTPDSKSRYQAFVGWEPRITTVTKNTTYTAVYDDPYNPAIHMIHYDLDGGSFYYSPTYYFTFGQQNIFLYQPYKSGYSFEGWFDDYGNEVFEIDTYKTQDIYLYARWYQTGCRVDISFSPSYIKDSYYDIYSNGSNAYYYAPEISGYVFDCWYKDGNYYSSSRSVSFYVYNDISLEAFYKSAPSSYLVSYSTNVPGYSYSGSSYYSYGAPCSLNAPAIPSYIFQAWYLNGSYYSANSFISFSVNSDMDLEARYNYEFGLNLNGSYYEITSYSGSASYLVIPESYNGRPIIGIADNAFYNNYSIYSIVIPSSIEYIGAYAFEYSSIREFEVSSDSNLYSIGQGAFYGCSYLEDVDFTFANSLSSLSPYLFCNCSNLTSVILPNALSSICYYAFYGIQAEITVVLPSVLNYVESYAFYNCPNLTVQAYSPAQISSWPSDWYSGIANVTFLYS